MIAKTCIPTAGRASSRDARLPFQEHSMNDSDTNKLLLVIIAILLPPLAVGLKEGVGGQFVLNIVLWILFYVPGLIHALWVVLK
jgi:uncharacterized membrane protein YqaE (UPF0057 family)